MTTQVKMKKKKNKLIYGSNNSKEKLKDCLQ